MTTDRRLSIAIAASGVLTYSYLMFFVQGADYNNHFGTFIYNYYFLSIIEGRLDIPLQIATLEGHYNSAGEAFVYHGIGPLLTRAIAYPFVDLTKTSLAPATIWSFSVAGTAAYHLLFLRVLSRLGPKSAQHRTRYTALLGVMVWFASPGIYLVLNDSVYHEPITMSYFAVAGFLLLCSGPALSENPWQPILVPLAVFAGVAVFTRPHVAIGLYVAVLLLLMMVMRENGRRALPHVLTTLFVLLLFGGSQFILNELRFGNIFRMHGSMNRDSIEYGIIYFGYEDVNSPRNLAFAEHGKFNIARIFPNSLIYLLDARFTALTELTDNYNLWLQNGFMRLTQGLGFIRQEPPYIGIVFLWLPWFFIFIAAVGLKCISIQRWWIVIFATVIAALFTLAYGTITFRYRTDIWPLIVVISVIILPMHWTESEKRPIRTNATIFALVIAIAFSLSKSGLLIRSYPKYFGGYETNIGWSQETCAVLVAQKETLGVSMIERLCVINVD